MASCIKDSTESTDKSCRVVCEPKCKEKDCDIPICPPVRLEELVCRYRDAVVTVQAEWIFLGANQSQGGTATVSGATATTPLGFDLRTDLITNSNGFFVKGHYIVCPAVTVLAPPANSSQAIRYPFQDGDHTVGGPLKNKMTRATRILVTVHNVNNKGHSFVYEAQLIGVDGAGDLAVLKICRDTAWNVKNPRVEKCHPYLTLGNSRATHDGQTVYILADDNVSVSVSTNTLSDHRYLDLTGYALQEMITITIASIVVSMGAPVINQQGEVLAYTTYGGPFLNNAGLIQIMGPSTFFFERALKTIIKNHCRKECCSQLETICDPMGSYVRYLKAYAGIAYDVFLGPDYDFTEDFTSGGQNGPRIRLDGNGNLLTSPTCKQIVGLRVLGLAGDNPDDSPAAVPNGFWYVPGGTASVGSYMASPLPVSSFLDTLLPGDVITHIDGVPLGNENKQIAPSLIMWRLRPGDTIMITFRRGGNAINTAANDTIENYDKLYTISACLGSYPYLMDYPWYVASNFAGLATNFGGNFVNVGQLNVSFNGGPGSPSPSYNPNNGFPPFHPAF